MHKYELVLKELSQMVDSHEPGHRLPGERELATRFGVSAMTVRRALQILLDSGRVTATPGRGTFVATPRVFRSFAAMGFTELMRASGRVPTTRCISADVGFADPAELALFGLDEGARVYHLLRLRLGDGKPLSIERATLPAERLPGLLGHDLDGSLYEILRAKYGVTVTRGRFVIQAMLPDKQTAERLSIPESTPCLAIETFSRAGPRQVIEHTQAISRGDLYSLTFEPESDESLAAPNPIAPSA
ncbi:MAG: GntR family transcriptional regulator [Bifidobacteriaceae bacterium]|jgi:GntR family transcriptional regulator|nr:GntR family transcriptional regulator [Bifidobacteriaceae bacterium]